FELLFPDAYSRTFDILSYYVNTRNFSMRDFWNQDSSLFVSATRPDERFLLGFLNIHRASSIFLEPVSLGNYAIVVTAFTLAFWREMSAAKKIFFALTTLIIVVGSDGRLAATTCTALVLSSFIFPFLPRYSNVFYLPGALVLCVTVVI